MSPKQFTFKTEKPFTIYLTVIKQDIYEDGNPNCDWKWIRLSKKSESLLEAKEWLNNSIKIILAKYNLKLL